MNSELMSLYNKVRSIPLIYAHSKNVLELVVYMIYNADLKLTIKEFSEIYNGCMLHDLGKTKIPSRILNKSQKLSSEEVKLIHDHSNVGYGMAKDILKGQETTLSMIRSHHEKLNGTGYGEGLTREAIPFYTQMLTVADIYEALTHKRAYRDVIYRHNEAMEVMYSMEDEINMAMLDLLRDYKKNQGKIDLCKDIAFI